MTPEYLRELADLADPDKLWTLGAFECMYLPPERRRQLDAGIALRRHAEHVKELRRLLGTGKSLLLTPLSENGTAIMTTRTPAAHRKLVECRQKPNVRAKLPTEAGAVSLVRDDAPSAADQAYCACRSGSA